MSDHKNLAEALAAFQSELPRVGKGNTAKVQSDKGSYTYRYADLADVSTLVLPLLGKHGLSFSAKPTIVGEGRFVLEYTLRHSSGDSDVGFYPLQSTGTPQQIGSAITYAKRYALCAMTGVAPDGDDDGEAANEQYEASQAEERQAITDGFELEITSARTVDALTSSLKTALRSLRGKHITQSQYDRLFQAASSRRTELEGKNEPDRNGAGDHLVGSAPGAGEDGGGEASR